MTQLHVGSCIQSQSHYRYMQDHGLVVSVKPDQFGGEVATVEWRGFPDEVMRVAEIHSNSWDRFRVIPEHELPQLHEQLVSGKGFTL